MKPSKPDVYAGFVFGLSVAEHIYGIDAGRRAECCDPAAIAKLANEVAAGNITLHDTPEEIASGEELELARFLMPEAIRDEREVAEIVGRYLSEYTKDQQ